MLFNNESIFSYVEIIKGIIKIILKSISNFRKDLGDKNIWFDVETKWNTLFKMIDLCLVNYDAINNINENFHLVIYFCQVGTEKINELLSFLELIQESFVFE